MNIIKYKLLFFIISLVIIIPGMISLVVWRLDLSIDFTGGSRLTWTLPSTNEKTITTIQNIFHTDKQEIVTKQISGKQIIIRTAPMDQKQHAQILGDMKKVYPSIREDGYETVGPTIGQEITANAVKGIALASLFI